MLDIADLKACFHGPAPLVPSDFKPNLIWRNEARVPCQAVLSTGCIPVLTDTVYCVAVLPTYHCGQASPLPSSLGPLPTQKQPCGTLPLAFCLRKRRGYILLQLLL